MRQDVANRAAARLKLKKYADARDDARASRTLDPRFLKAWYREGEAALELEQYEDSALAFFEGLQIDGDNADCKRMFDEAIARDAPPPRELKSEDERVDVECLLTKE